MKKVFILIVMASLLSSCATSYHRKSFTGGYSEIQIDDNIFKVSFKGNSKTSMERAVDFALLRSAELTMRNGFDYFTITKGSQYVKEDYHKHYDPFDTYPHITYPHITQKPRVSFRIHLYKTKPKRHSYNANLLARSIKDKYRIK